MFFSRKIKEDLALKIENKVKEMIDSNLNEFINNQNLQYLSDIQKLNRFFYNVYLNNYLSNLANESQNMNCIKEENNTGPQNMNCIKEENNDVYPKMNSVKQENNDGYPMRNCIKEENH